MNLLVLSASASALNVAYALHDRADVHLVLTDASRYASGLYLPWVRGRVIPRADDLDAYGARLNEIIAADAIDALLATSDADMRAIAALRTQGRAPAVRMFTPDPAVLDLMTSKRRLPVRLADLGIPAPRVYADRDTAAAPAVLKPDGGSGAKDVVIVHDAEHLRRAWDGMQRRHGSAFVCQEYVPGDTGSIHVVMLLYDEKGACRAAAASRSTLTFLSWGGGGNGGEIIDDPDLVAHARAVVEALGGWRGPINLEFKRRGGDGEAVLIEINCRLNGYSYLYTMNGLDFPAMIVDLLRGEHAPAPAVSPRTVSMPPAQRVPFVLGFREMPVPQWVDEAGPPPG